MELLKGWIKLICISAGVIAFFVWIGPLGLKMPGYKPVADFIVENDINANAYYYTEVSEFADADFHMRNHVMRDLYK
jgi:hypothetical protein